VAELREIAGGRGDLLAERAGVILGFHDEDARDGRWPRRALEAALCIAAGADLTPDHGMDRRGAGAGREGPLRRGVKEAPRALARILPSPAGIHRYVASVIVLDRRPVIRIRSVTPRGASWSPSSNGSWPDAVAGLRQVARITPE
jgi:hypothetical protein